MPIISSPTATVPLMQQLQTKMVKANLTMKRAPNPDNLKAIIEQLSTVIQEIQEEQTKNQAEEKFCCLRTKGWERVSTTTLVLGGVGTLCGLIANGIDYKNNLDPSSGGIVANSIAITLLGCAALTKLVVKKTQKKIEAYFSLQDRQLNEAISLHNFFTAMNLYLNIQPANPERQDRKYKKCAQELKRVPSEIIPSKAKARWMRAAAQTLSVDSPLRRKLTEAEQLVLQKVEEAEEMNKAKVIDDAPSHLSSSYSEEASPEPKRRRGKKKRSNFLKDENADRLSNPSPKASVTQNTEKLCYEAAQELLSELGLDVFCGDTCMFDKDGNLIKKFKT